MFTLLFKFYNNFKYSCYNLPGKFENSSYKTSLLHALRAVYGYLLLVQMTPQAHCSNINAIYSTKSGVVTPVQRFGLMQVWKIVIM